LLISRWVLVRSNLKPLSLLQKLKIFLFVAALWCSCTLFSQDIKPITFFLEAGGSGGFGSLNLDRLFYAKKNVRWSYRAGASYSPGNNNQGSTPVILIFPTLINFIYGKKDHFAEAGAGQSLALSSNPAIFSRLTLNAGYRFQRNEGGWFFRVSYTPLVSFIYDFQWQHWGGIGIGYTLKNKGKCPCETAK
jgi:hypothetical protein